MNNAWLERPETFWRAGFVLMALAVGFGVLTAMKAHGGDADNFAGMLFVTVTLGALTAASFLSALIGPRGTDKPRAP